MSAASLKSTHLLRALLREASYLPDANSRTFFRQYIVSRFKAYQPKQNVTASFAVSAIERYRHRSFKRRQDAIIKERTRPMIRKAQKGLNFLRRANQGVTPCLQKVLFFTYGRMGRRKYVLLEGLLRPDALVDGGVELPEIDGLAPLQALYYSNKRYLQYFDAPKPASKTHYSIAISNRYSRLRAVLKSQHQNGICISRDVKGPVMKTPINNIWERPMPIKRARNNVRRWYANTMSNLLPPLPTEEWDNMHAMISGEKAVSLKRRRVPILDSMSNVTDEDYFRDTVFQVITLDKPSRADKPAGMQRPHAITPRYMRRLYARILALCCKLGYNGEHKRWQATWGRPLRLKGVNLQTMATDELLFAGVDTKGRVPETPKPKTKSPGATVWVQPRNDKGEYMHFPFFAEYLPKAHPIRKELEEWKRKRAVATSELEASTRR